MGIEKGKLLKILDEAIALEDRSIPIYNKHLRTALFWSGLPVGAREQLRIQLGILEKESERHAEVLREMKNRIQEDDRDVF